VCREGRGVFGVWGGGGRAVLGKGTGGFGWRSSFFLGFFCGVKDGFDSVEWVWVINYVLLWGALIEASCFWAVGLNNWAEFIGYGLGFRIIGFL
jgi:hypothetical protein